MAPVPRRQRSVRGLHARCGPRAGRSRIHRGTARRDTGTDRRRSPLDSAPPHGPAMLTLAYPWLLVLLPAPLVVWRFVPAYRTPATGLRVPFLPRLARVT